MKFVTIGVYGSDEATFFEALQRAGVDTFCDIRWRRGVRGAKYAFANSARLQKRLAEQRDRLKLPDSVGVMKVENGELVMTQK